MTTLQEYLAALTNQEQITEINLAKIQQEREQQGTNELLEGGELDLTEFKQLMRITITPQFLATPLTKIVVDGLTSFQEIVWAEMVEESEEEKQLWVDLGIAAKTSENVQSKKVVREVQRLAEIFSKANSATINVYFATQQFPQAELQDKEGITIITSEDITQNIAKSYNIHLNLDRKDKAGNLAPSLVFYTLARELTLINHANFAQDPQFWKNFSEKLAWVKQNLSEEYQKELELLLNPSTFPHERLEMKDLLAVYFPSSERKDEFGSELVKTGKAEVDKVWKEIKEAASKVLEQELKTDPDVWFKLTIEFDPNQDEYIIVSEYHSHLERPMVKLLTDIPLKSEVEQLKQKQAELPTPENVEKLTKQNQLLASYLQDLTDAESYREIKEKIAKICA